MRKPGTNTLKAPGELALRPRFTPTHARDSMRVFDRVALGRLVAFGWRGCTVKYVYHVKHGEVPKVRRSRCGDKEVGKTGEEELARFIRVKRADEALGFRLAFVKDGSEGGEEFADTRGCFALRTHCLSCFES
eukprot:6177373-Pleurochrysis_carterae.AAC.1